ncbi:hypothetical protein [Streptomyces griseoviridis]|uniref:Transposase-like protein n=1 Tax=Streptomyces griseoviridis TaxID=45398 RepID=A0ABT9LA61_STRGD|nr:hypothetical protein [Streptomyces griseoviridis]MDP9680598.1 transposase-like protein [Streptomyces griseoviridis]GGT26306.1 hypothetical protein GCM10010240_68270 [Streptomyces griseoviridis]
MTYTDRTADRTARSVLRREIAGTIGLLTDEHDFRVMRRYRSFPFDDHPTYLRHVEDVLRTRAAQGSHTTIALFDPEEYAAYCEEAGLDPDVPSSRTRFTAELAATGPTVPYEGQPLTDVLPTLIDEAVRQATREYAAALLARLGSCASCGQDLGTAAYHRAAALITRVIDTAPAGRRHLVCSVSAAPETLLSVLHADTEPDGSTHLDETELLEFTSVLALGLATHSPGGLVIRTCAPDTPDRVYGWRLRGYGLDPLTAGEVFDAYCTDTESGDLISPESNVDYCAPPDLEDDDPVQDHHH